MSLRNKLGIKLVSGLVVLAVLVPAGVVVARHYVHLDLGFTVQADPLGYVDVVDQGRPNAAVPSKLLASLDRTTSRKWQVRRLQDWDPRLGGETYADNATGREELARAVTLPRTARVIGVATNTAARSASKDGSLYLIWFNTPADAQHWLVQDEPIFSDEAIEGRRQSFWAGSFVVYYAPPVNGEDWSDAVRDSLTELARA